MIILCIKIFFARLIDVSLGTVRVIVSVKEKKLAASIIAFFEALIWFLVVKEALNFNGGNIILGISFALGFGAGTYIGGYLVKKFVPGKCTLQVFIDKENQNIIKEIRDKGYALTAIEYKGIEEEKEKLMIYINVDTKQEDKVKKLIKSLDPKAFIVVNESKYVVNGYFK